MSQDGQGDDSPGPLSEHLAALESFVEDVDRQHQGLVWQSGCNSWYLGADGVNFSLWPGSTLRYMAQTKRFDPGVYRKQRRT